MDGDRWKKEAWDVELTECRDCKITIVQLIEPGHLVGDESPMCDRCFVDLMYR